VADLDQIVDLGGFPNHATAKMATIDGRLEADFDIIRDNNPV
jgi:hypothetical protein